MTDMQELFCQEYLIDCNATRAAIRAGYSENSSKEIAYQLIQNVEVSERIRILMTERSKRVGVNQDFVLSELIALARVGEGSVKVRALELLGKHMHMFNEKLDINITLAKKAEEFQKLTAEQQLELMKEEVKRLEGQVEKSG